MPSAPSLSGRTAVVAGATGLVGRALVRVLLRTDGYGRVVALARSAQPREGAAHEPVVVDYDRLDAAALPLRGADVFCALGTTIKAAGSQDAFRKVDFSYVAALAAAAAASGARSFGFVSALGADPSSRVFYSRVKGEAERAVASSGVPVVHVFRPSLLLGRRDTFRLGERLAEAVLAPLSIVLRGPLANARPIHGDTVAAAMVATAQGGDAPGVYVHDPEAMRRLAAAV